MNYRKIFMMTILSITEYGMLSRKSEQKKNKTLFELIETWVKMKQVCF